MRFIKHILLTIFILPFACAATERAPYFYRLEKDGRVSHLLGTVHFGVSLMDLPIDAWWELDQSDQVTVEMHYSNVVSQSLRRGMAWLDRKVLDPGTVKKGLSQKHLNLLLDRLEANGFPAEVAERVGFIRSHAIGRSKTRRDGRRHRSLVNWTWSWSSTRSTGKFPSAVLNRGSHRGGPARICTHSKIWLRSWT